jgi:hypothetical protein
VRRTIRNVSYKLIERAAGLKWTVRWSFDLQNDPYETKNLLKRTPTAAQRSKLTYLDTELDKLPALSSAADPTGNQRRSRERSANRPNHQLKVEPRTLPDVAASHSGQSSNPRASGPSMRTSDVPGSSVAEVAALANRPI